MTPRPPRSTFVTIVASLFIALATLALLSSLAMAVAGFAIGALPEVRRAFDAPPPEDMPVLVFGLFKYVGWVGLAMFVTSASRLASAIALLQRRPWGRRWTIVDIVIVMAWYAAGLAMVLELLWLFFDSFGASARQGGLDTRPLIVMWGVMATLFCVMYWLAYGWVAHRLMSPAVVAEFRS